MHFKEKWKLKLNIELHLCIFFNIVTINHDSCPVNQFNVVYGLTTLIRTQTSVWFKLTSMLQEKLA